MKRTWPQTMDIICIYWALFWVLFKAVPPLFAAFSFSWMIYRLFKTNLFKNGV